VLIVCIIWFSSVSQLLLPLSKSSAARGFRSLIHSSACPWLRVCGSG